MADFDSSLPIRTQTNGDVAVKIVDGTVVSNALTVDSSGKVTVKLDDAAGTGITSTLIASKQSLDVNVANTTPIPVTGTITAVNSSVSATGATPPSDATYIAGSVTTAAPTYVSGQMDPLSLTTAGALRVDGSATTQPISGSVTVSSGAITVSGTVAVSSIADPVVVSSITAPVAISSIASPLPAGTNTIGAVTQASGPWTQNLTQILGSAPSASNALPAQLSTGGAYVSATNPLPVTLDPEAAGTPVSDYKNASAIASGASDNHDYTVTALKTLYLEGIRSSASGKAKMVVQVETGVATGVFTTHYTMFNSTATPNMNLDVPSPLKIAAGIRVRVIMSNRDLLAEDLYSTIAGFEV